MELIIDHPHLIDTLRFRLQSSRAVPQGDLRVIVPITALVKTAERDLGGLESRIHEALAEFMKAGWAFSRLEREGEAVGFERVRLRASARVPVAENWNLAERARKASREGLALGAPEISYAISTEKVNAVIEELRLELLRESQVNAQRMSEASSRLWRIGDIEFGTPGMATDGTVPEWHTL